MTDLPARIGRYEVLGQLGQGGMGVLYLARDPVLDRHVALKLLKVDSDDLRRRFVHEARSAGRLQHPNIVTVYDVDDHDGQLFIAMEYIDGDTLGTLIRNEVPFSSMRKLEMMDQLADGLGFAHGRGLIHRDIKPANLMVTRGGLLKVLDFGIARLAHRQSVMGSAGSGSLIGTPAYMSPEQLQGGLVDHRSDIFAVGLVMYELFSGRRAFSGATTAEVLQKVVAADPTPIQQLVPHIDTALARCVDRALAKQPAERYQDLQDLRNDLGRVRRRVEFESGAFDATIVVQAPVLTQPVTRPADAPPPAPSLGPPPVPRLEPAQAATTTPASTAASTTGVPAASDHHDERAVLEYLSKERTRGTRPLAMPCALDETIYAALPAVPHMPPEAAAVHDSRVSSPAVTSSAGIQTEPAPATDPPRQALGAPMPASVRPSLVPALVAVGVLVLLFAASGIAAVLWLRSNGWTSHVPTTAARMEPVDEAPAAETPLQPHRAPDVVPPVADDVASVSPGSDTASASSPAGPEASLPNAELPASGPVQSPSPTSGPTPAAQQRPVASTARPGQVLSPPVAREPITTGASALPPAPSASVSSAPERPVSAASNPREDAVALVQAYVEARNASHEPGLRRVWPSVNEVELRRMTGEFAAPLTLVSCDVAAPPAGAASATRMQAACQFTQPGSTGFSQGTPLNIRRRLVFDMERQAAGWVITNVAS